MKDWQLCFVITKKCAFRLFVCFDLWQREFYPLPQVAFFNNYLLDPKRPALPEHPGNRPPPPREGGQFSAGANMSGAPSQPPASMMGGYGGRNPHMMYGGKGVFDLSHQRIFM